MQFVMNSLGILRVLAQKLGPYLLLEIVLPGGTLCALLLFLYRRRKTKAEAARTGRRLPQAGRRYRALAGA